MVTVLRIIDVWGYDREVIFFNTQNETKYSNEITRRYRSYLDVSRFKLNNEIS